MNKRSAIDPGIILYLLRPPAGVRSVAARAGTRAREWAKRAAPAPALCCCLSAPNSSCARHFNIPGLLVPCSKHLQFGDAVELQMTRAFESAAVCFRPLWLPCNMEPSRYAILMLMKYSLGYSVPSLTTRARAPLDTVMDDVMFACHFMISTSNYPNTVTHRPTICRR